MSAASRDKATPATDAGKLLIRLGLAVLLIGLPVAGVGSFEAIYALLPVGAISILCGAVIIDPERGLQRMRTAILSPLGAAAALLVAWAGLSLLWTPFPGPAGERLFKMVAPTALAAVTAAYLPERTRSFDLYVPPLGVAAAAVAALALVLLPWPGRGAGPDETLLERTVITLIVLVWPALGALALREHWLMAALLALLVAGVALVDLARITLAAMGTGAFVFAVAMSAPERIARLLAATSAGLVLLAPLLPLALGGAYALFGGTPASIEAWWDIVVGQWPRLVTGHGFDLANVGRILGFLPAEAPQSLLFLLWYDLGAVGALAFAILVALAFLAAGKVPSLVGPAMLAGLSAILVIAFLGIAVGQIWWITLLDAAAIGFALVGKAVQGIHRPGAVEIGAAAEGLELAAAGPAGVEAGERNKFV